MRTALYIAGGTIGLLIIAGLIFYFIGRTLPEKHTAKFSTLLPAPPEAVWTVITDYSKMPEWWPAVKSILLETRPNGEVWTWNQDSRGHKIAFRTIEEKAPRRLVREIVGDNLPFSGTWTFELTPEGATTRLTLTEDGFIKPPLFRFIATYFIGLDKTMKDFAKHLEKRFGAAAS